MQINCWLLWFRTLGTSFSRAPKDHRLHETFVLAHAELAGAPLYTLNIRVAPHPQYSHCHPPGVVQTFHSGAETVLDKSSSAFPSQATSSSGAGMSP